MDCCYISIIHTFVIENFNIKIILRIFKRNGQQGMVILKKKKATKCWLSILFWPWRTRTFAESVLSFSSSVHRSVLVLYESSHACHPLTNHIHNIQSCLPRSESVSNRTEKNTRKEIRIKPPHISLTPIPKVLSSTNTQQSVGLFLHNNNTATTTLILMPRKEKDFFRFLKNSIFAIHSQ